jgi:hypothetical protein
MFNTGTASAVRRMCLAAVCALTVVLPTPPGGGSVAGAQTPIVLVEQVVRVGAAGGLVSATLDPGRRPRA